MRLSDDDRARVPFAIVGVVLLLGSAAYVTTLQGRGPSVTHPDAELARERLDSALDAEVRGAIRRAAAAAAREPVVDPADTPVGRLLDGATPFRDYLRIRIYVEVRRTLAGLHVSTGAVTGEASLPSTPDVDALRQAMTRVQVDRGDQRGTIEVRIENVTVRLIRDGKTIRRRQRSITRTVASPVLLLHDRVETFQRRLNRGPLDGPGFGRRFAAGLYALAWMRGYLQYAGVPIQNVIATRHVGVVTNSALLATQRSVFGRSDPGGRAATRRAVAQAGLYDVLAASGSRGNGWLDEVLAPTVPGASDTIPTPGAPTFDPPGPEAELSVGVGVTAVTAFADLLDETTAPSLNATLQSVYSAEVRLGSAGRTVRTEQPPDPVPPGDNWTLVDETVETRMTVSNATGPLPPVADGWDRLRSYSRRVAVHNTVTWTWTAGNDSTERETSATWTNVSRVGIGLDARHSPTDRIPRQGIESVYEPGGPFDGPNLADVEAAAVRRLVESRGGPDALARRAVHGSLDESEVVIEGERPGGLSARVYRDLQKLRERIKNVNVTVRRGRAGVGSGNPAAALARKLRERRSTLVGIPTAYDNVAEKARIAARAAYVDAVIEGVRQRARRTDRRVAAMDDEFGEFGVDLDAAAEIMALDTAVPARSPLYVGPGGPVGGTVTASPAYLTVEPVPDDRLPTVDDEFYPLVTRNHNLVAAPYGDLAGAVIDAVLGDDTGTVGLETAARALASANRTLENETDDQLATRRDHLEGEIRSSIGTVKAKLVEVLGERTSLGPDDRRLVVHAALGRWDSVHARALALVNGSAAGAVATRVDRQANISARQRDRLQVELRLELASLVEDEDVRVAREEVDETATITRLIAGRTLASEIEEGVNRTAADLYERWAGDHLVSVPAGLPLAPVPGFWYVTANAWNVSARGTYARFAVGARTGPPDGGTAVTYVRDGTAVELDVFGDGDPVVLGRATRISFEMTVPVVVVVPPGGRGVGDVDGTADERSEGWPEPGVARRARTRVTTP